MHDDDDKRHNSGRARNRSPAPHRGQTMTTEQNGETPSLPRTRSTVVYRTPYGDDDDDHGNGCISPRQRSPSQTQRPDAPELPEARHRTHSASPASVTAPASNRSSLHGLHGPQRSSHRSSDHSRDTSTHHPHTSRRTFPDGSDAHPPLTPPLRAAVSPRTIPQHLSRVESGSPSWMVLESGSSSPGVSVAAGRTEDAPAAVSPPSLSFPDHPDSFHGASGFAEDCTTASLTPPMGSQGGKVMMVELEGDETEARPTGRIPDFSGFGNRRNDCYACSILTMLLRCPTFRQGLLHSPLHRASRHLEWLLQGASAPLPPEGWGSGYLPLPITGGGGGKRSRSPSTSSPSSQPPPPTRSPRRGAPSKKQKRTTSNTNGTTKQSEDALAAEQERRRCGLDLGIAELVVALSLEVGSSSGSSSSSATASATSISNEVNSEEHAAGDEAEQEDTQPDREPMVAIPDVYRYIHNVLSSFVAEQRRREGLIQRLHTPAHFPNRGRIYRQFVRRYELSMNGRAAASSDDDGEDDEDNVIGYAPGPSLYERGVILHPLAACFDDDFFTGEQEDAHEFFVALVARLESEAMLFDRRLAEVRELKEDEEENLKRDVTSVAVLPPKEVWINELLQGRLLNMIRCMNDTCRHEIVTEETFINISISFPEKPQPAEPLFEERTADAPVEIPNLATLLHRSMEYEALDGYRCDKCGSTSQQFQGGCFLGTPPSMLIVQLKRFHISFEQGQAVMRKDDQKVGVPEDLTVYSLPLELIRPCSSDEDKEESANDRDNEEGENSTVSEQNSLAKTLDDSLVAARGRAEAQSGAQSATNTGKCSPDTFIDCLEVTYRIHGVVLHVGRSLQSGHYIAFFAVRGPSSSGVAEEVQWKLANDEEVGDVDLDLLHDRTSHGYMFVFEKVREQRVRRPVGDVLPLAVNGPSSKASLC